MEPKYVAVKGNRGVDVRCCIYVQGPIIKAHDAKNSKEPIDHNIANFGGLTEIIGRSTKQITKQARAPRLQPANISIRSHLLKANHASSSSLLLGAGSGAPAGPSVVGSRTEPSFPNGFSDLMDDRSPVCLDVFTGTSARRDHPREFMESLNEEDAIVSLRYLNRQALPDRPNMDQCAESEPAEM